MPALKPVYFDVLYNLYIKYHICVMKEQNNILTAPETMDINALFEFYRTLPNNESFTLDEFYSFLTTPSVARDSFFLTVQLSPIISGDVVRQQYTL